MTTQAQRISYAARVIREGRQTSRRFDTCFESGDGDEVARKLWEKAAKCRKLASNISRYLSRPGCSSDKPEGLVK